MKIPLAGLPSSTPIKCPLCPYATPAYGSYRSRGRTHHWDGYDRLKSHVIGKHPNLARTARLTPYQRPITRQQEASREAALLA